MAANAALQARPRPKASLAAGVALAMEETSPPGQNAVAAGTLQGVAAGSTQESSAPLPSQSEPCP